MKGIRLALMVLLTIAMAQATPISGKMSLTGFVGVSATVIDWMPPAGGGVGAAATIQAATGYFSGLVHPLTPLVNYTTTIVDLIAGSIDPPQAAWLSAFTAPGYGGLRYDLAAILAPAGAACTGLEGVGQSCSFGVFNLLNNGAGTTITLKVTGDFVDTIFGITAPGVGRFSTQTGNGIPWIMTEIGAGRTIGPISYSAEFNAVPEPATAALLGSSLIALAFFRRRR